MLYWQKKRLLFVCFLALSIVLFVGCESNDPETQAKIIQPCGHGNFYVSSEDLGTTAKGTILVYEKGQDVLGIRIVSFIDIGSDDWGGIAFFLPAGCVLDSIMCTYPETGEQTRQDSSVTWWSSESDNGEYHLAVEIGRNRYYKPSGGGRGTVIVDASFAYGEKSNNEVISLKFSVECGASVENGYVIWGVEHENILVDIRKPD